MNNKFASLGTALSRDEAKKVMGGKMAPLPGDFGDLGGSGTGATPCTSDADCAQMKPKVCSKDYVEPFKCNTIQKVCQAVCVY